MQLVNRDNGQRSVKKERARSEEKRNNAAQRAIQRDITDFSFEFVCSARGLVLRGLLYAQRSRLQRQIQNAVVFIFLFCRPLRWIAHVNYQTVIESKTIRSNFLLRFLPAHCSARRTLPCSFACWMKKWEKKRIKTQSEQMAESQPNQKYTRKHIKL